MNDTFVKLQKILEQYSDETVAEHSSIEDLLLDDIDLNFIEADINKEFSIVLPPYKYYEVNTVDELVNLINSL